MLDPDPFAVYLFLSGTGILLGLVSRAAGERCGSLPTPIDVTALSAVCF